MAKPVAFKYRAFMSYSHADTTWAKWLHRGLEGVRIDKDLVGRDTAFGPVPKSLRPVFRDRDDFTAGHSLTNQTLAALDASAALIVICSPAAAKSDYVTEEIRLFKSRHPNRPVIPLIVDGTPGDADVECFPRSLKFELDPDGKITDKPIELLAADVREQGDGKDLALAKVVAGLLGVSSDDIFRRAERERRRKSRIRNGVIAALALLVVAASGSAVYAWHQLRTNEAFLAATLDRATSIVNTAVSQAETYGVPRRATLQLLAQAEGLFDDMARLGRPTAELRYQKAWMLIQFARNYAMLGDTEKWDERTREAYGLFADLAEEDALAPNHQKGLLAAQHELGDVLSAQGKSLEALQIYLKSRTTAQKFASDQSNPDTLHALSVSHERVGNAFLAQGDVRRARQSFENSLAIWKLLADTDPDNVELLRGISIANDKIGDILSSQGSFDDALVYYRASIAIIEPLAESDGDNVTLQHDLSIDFVNLGDALRGTNDLPAALQAYRKSLAIRQRLADADKSSAAWQRDLSIAHNKVGDVLLAQGDFPEALAAYDKGLSEIKEIAVADKTNTGYQRDLAVSHIRIGDVLAAQGDLAGALQSYHRSLVVAHQLAALDPRNAGWQRDLAANYWKAATILRRQRDSSSSLAMFNKGRAIVIALAQQFPDNPQFRKDAAEFDAEIAALGRTNGPSPAQDQVTP